MRTVLLPLALALASLAHGQITWDIRDPGAAVDARCGECVRVMESMPKEVMFGLFVDEQLDIWFVLNDPRFFDKLFKRPGDGIAVDVVERSRYACGREVPEQTGWHKGTLLKPVYLPELQRERGTAEDGTLYTKVGRLPLPYKGKPVELNMLVVQDHYACWYNTFYELDSYRWDLLNMGLFMDSLTYHERADTAMAAFAKPALRRKALHFTIPFARGRTEYAAQDLRPLVDSLRLTDFAIKHIDIHAFSSVEGPEEENIRLQEERARSIARALQSYQKPSIRLSVSASENWVEFLQDIAGTRHAGLAGLSRAEVKARLRDRSMANSLEPILARHRKAVVTLELQRRTEYTDMAATKLVTEFERSLEDRNMERAAAIQREVFERVMDRDLPVGFIDRLEVPQRKPFALLLNSRAAFRHFMDPSDVFATYQALQELDRLAPGSAPIKYNLCAVKFRLWLVGTQAVDPDAFRLEIDRLLSYGIDPALVQRMHVNRHIILAEQYMRQGDYRRKDECLAFIHANYHLTPMSDMDHLNLAQYYASYGDRDRALEVIVPHLTRPNVGRNLLFYYLNLTLVEEEITSEAAYQKLLQHAIRLDRRRFCRLFRPFGQGGISFQLLEDEHLRELYCKQCDGVYDL
jgi:hypothetical protein